MVLGGGGGWGRPLPPVASPELDVDADAPTELKAYNCAALQPSISFRLFIVVRKLLVMVFLSVLARAVGRARLPHGDDRAGAGVSRRNGWCARASPPPSRAAARPRRAPGRELWLMPLVAGGGGEKAGRAGGGTRRFVGDGGEGHRGRRRSVAAVPPRHHPLLKECPSRKF
jgi:hypothetical protein